MARRKLIAGNWKMNGSLAANRQLLQDLINASIVSKNEVLVCVPYVYIASCVELAQQSQQSGAVPILIGAQDVSVHDTGAYTGEISAAMLKDLTCRYVIVGHSERRTYHGESNDWVAQKALQVFKNGMTPIVCVGETLAEREAGQTQAIVCAQLLAVANVLNEEQLSQLVVAYEPVWAIGTGKTATPEMAQEVHAVLRASLLKKNPSCAEKIRILYGGSMKADNAKELLAMPDVDGGLIGGASLKAGDFAAIIQAA